MTIDHWISVQKYMLNLGDNNSTTTRQLSVAKQLDSSKLCHQKATPKSRVAIKVCTNNQRVAYVKKKLRQVDKLITKKQTTSSCSCQFLPETSTEIPKRSSSSHLQNVHNRLSFLNSERLKHVRPGTVQSSVAPSGA